MSPSSNHMIVRNGMNGVRRIYLHSKHLNMYPCIQSRVTYVGSTICLQVPCKFPASAMHQRIRFICNAYATPKNLQRICTWYKIHEFLRRRLQRICKSEKSAMQMRRRCRQLAGNLQGTCKELADKFKKDHIQYGNLSASEKILRSSPDTVLVNERL